MKFSEEFEGASSCPAWLRFAAAICFVLPLFCASACVSIQDRELSWNERNSTEILGQVTDEFISFQFFHVKNENALKRKAYDRLLEAARLEYGHDVDIRNIRLEGKFTPWELLNIAAFPAGWLIGDSIGHAIGNAAESAAVGYGTGIPIGVTLWLAAGNTQKIAASGDVVAFTRAPSSVSSNSVTGSNTGNSSSVSGRAETRVTKSLETAVGKLADNLVRQMPENVTVAILSISAQENQISDYILDELEYLLVNSRRFKVADRKTIDKVREEQAFQVSGEVADDDAVRLGAMLGASLVITGSVSNTGTAQRVSVKVLDVQTAEILVMTREQF